MRRQDFWKQSPLPPGEAKFGHWSYIVTHYAVTDYNPGAEGRLIPADVYVYHYGVQMARLLQIRDGSFVALKLGTGTGSKSDQRGMNEIFNELKLPYYFNRSDRNPR